MWCVCVNKQNPPKNGIVLPSRFQGSEVALLGDEVFFGVFVVFPPSLFFQAGSLFTGGLMTGLWWMMRLKKEGRKEDYGGQLFFLMQLIKKMQALPRRDQAPKFHQGQVRSGQVLGLDFGIGFGFCCFSFWLACSRLVGLDSGPVLTSLFFCALFLILPFLLLLCKYICTSVCSVHGYDAELYVGNDTG